VQYDTQEVASSISDSGEFVSATLCFLLLCSWSSYHDDETRGLSLRAQHPLSDIVLSTNSPASAEHHLLPPSKAVVSTRKPSLHLIKIRNLCWRNFLNVHSLAK